LPEGVVTPSVAASGALPAAAPKVSVVMTVYNAEPYLRDAIDSILRQTFGGFEFIIVNDGSTDRSPEILNEIARIDPRVRLISRGNTGIVAAANEGIAAARGQYLARMDADDVSLPRRFERQVEYLDAHPDCVVVGSRVMNTDPHGIPVAPSEHALTHAEIDAQLMTVGGGWALLQPATMMRLEAVRKVGGYRGAYNISEDHDLFLRLAEVGTVANLPDVLFHYRRRYDGASHTHLHQLAEAKEKVLREAHQRRGLPVPPGWKVEPWKPVPVGEQARAWGWAALRAGNVAVAREHAGSALRHAPFSAATWRLVFCALRGR
jgi:glycosyltransferase involved in cell wall biosynthesis